MEINWEHLWLEAKRGSVLEKRPEDLEIAVYDRGAEAYRNAIKEKSYEYRQILEYGQQIVDVLKDIIKPDFEVLDIGTGPGTLAIPIARLVKNVVALDPSKGMITALEESAVTEGIDNIATINKTWQGVDDAEIREKFDLVISSEVVWQFDDVGTQLMRIHDASRKYCCVILHAGLTDNLDSELWSMIMNKEYNFGIDYIYIYNILHSKEIYANVNVIDSNYTFEKSVNDAIEYYVYLFDLYTELTPRIKKIIKDYIVENAVNGVYHRESKMKSAVMWWKK
jgi:2-polyprenyl-3-methyl-5-hydroxy-6-metoxy-1,4-benzoquinol methylase